MTFDNLLGYILSISMRIQSIPNGLRVIDIFHEQTRDKIFTNRPGTKSSQTVRWQNQMFDYRALYEIKLQVSADFLGVVQYHHRNDELMMSFSVLTKSFASK